ncbi:MAG: amidohydrolase [Lachnospiraceae bacterium]|nr:amidohydrolase [Lachnospiraceae bacterium]
MKILIKEIMTVLPDQRKKFAVHECNVYIEDDIIKSVIETEKKKDTRAPFSDKTADKVINGKNKLLLPGLINAHTHIYMNFMRCCGDDLAFNDWLFKRIYPIEDKMTDTDAYWGTQLGLLEMIESGTTGFIDMNLNMDPCGEAIRKAGLRGIISRGLVGEGPEDEGAIRRIKETMEAREKYLENDLIEVCMGPHASYSCEEKLQHYIADLAMEYNMKVNVHLSESRKEVEDCKNKYGVSPIALAERTGLFANRTIAAHCVHIDDADLDILAKNKVTVATNPVSNMKLGNGVAPVPKMLKKRINVALGTDGAASNNTLNMFHELSVVTLIHKGVNEEAQCVSAKEGLFMMTMAGAKAMGKEYEIGSVEDGKKADLIILNTDTASFMPRNDYISALAYSCNGSEVETVIVNGRIIMENREVLTLDKERIFFENEKIMNRIIKK